jgi:N-acylglucosamine-6-phosphate 2-epimerase
VIENGLIVSIQKYKKGTTQELANCCVQAGAVAIRTEHDIKIKKPIIGLEKLNYKEFYITTEKDSILRVGKWADYIAIDSRKGNIDIDFLYSICHVNNFKIVADIENIDDVKNVLNICESKKIIKPSYFATTFSDCNIELINEIIAITEIPVIAEGGYYKQKDIKKAVENKANNICIGTAISDIISITKKFIKYMEI